MKAKHNIEEYSFSQTTLEQVFIRFAKEQEMEDVEEEENSKNNTLTKLWLRINYFIYLKISKEIDNSTCIIIS